MYPQRELALLEARKVVLRKNIALHRTQCAIDARRVAQPLEWMDKVIVLWRKMPALAKWAALPLGLVAAKRIFFRRQKILGPLLGWVPILFDAWGSMNSRK